MGRKIQRNDVRDVRKEKRNVKNTYGYSADFQSKERSAQ